MKTFRPTATIIKERTLGSEKTLWMWHADKLRGDANGRWLAARNQPDGTR
jgi:hypothetical protein